VNLLFENTHIAWEMNRSHRIVLAGSVFQIVFGIAVVILTILALSGVVPLVLAAWAGLAFGGAIVLEALILAARRAATDAGDLHSPVRLEMREGGVIMALISGATVSVLGGLALAGVAPAPLMACTSVIGGAGLLFSTGSAGKSKASRRAENTGSDDLEPLIRPRSAHLLGGLAAIALGILALDHVASREAFAVVGVLVLGLGLTLAGTAIFNAEQELSRNEGSVQRSKSRPM